jgi:pyridoxal phosphate enzyme (YggS family)
VTRITDHLASVRARAREALLRAGRPADDIMIVAVSKQQSVEAIQEAYRAGQRHFGESYVQEALPKIEIIDAHDIVWHFIGRIQSNKTRAVAEHFQWIHTLDRGKTAERLHAQRPYYAPPLNVLIQVDLAAEQQKGGVTPDAAESLAEAVLGLPRLRLRGLMTIPPAGRPARETEGYFDELAALHRRLAAGGVELDTLSMGMSGDFEAAIEHGSNCVRVGTAIFGERGAR